MPGDCVDRRSNRGDCSSTCRASAAAVARVARTAHGCGRGHGNLGCGPSRTWRPTAASGGKAESGRRGEGARSVSAQHQPAAVLRGEGGAGGSGKKRSTATGSSAGVCTQQRCRSARARSPEAGISIGKCSGRWRGQAWRCRGTQRQRARRGTAVAPPPPRPLRARRFRSVRPTALLEKVAPGGVIASLALPARWRISGTTLEHSTDGGSTWSSVATGVTSELTAVSSPSSIVCWVVGRGGVVLRTTDGQNFSRVAFPEITDLSAVQATDARSASVTASDGRVFRTSDGGAHVARSLN